MKKQYDKSSFAKLFKELYGQNPDKWNRLLEANKTKYSEAPKPTKQNRQVMSSEAFGKLLRINQKQFDDFSRKADAQVNKPKSIRINGETLGQNRRTNQRNKNADTSFVDSEAISSFNIKDNNDGTKDVTIKYTSGNKEYLYPDVPANVANGMYAAPSKGSYAQDVIKQYSDYSNPKVQEKIREGN